MRLVFVASFLLLGIIHGATTPLKPQGNLSREPGLYTATLFDRTATSQKLFDPANRMAITYDNNHYLKQKRDTEPESYLKPPEDEHYNDFTPSEVMKMWFKSNYRRRGKSRDRSGLPPPESIEDVLTQMLAGKGIACQPDEQRMKFVIYSLSTEDSRYIQGVTAKFIEYVAYLVDELNLQSEGKITPSFLKNLFETDIGDWLYAVFVKGRKAFQLNPLSTEFITQIRAVLKDRIYPRVRSSGRNFVIVPAETRLVPLQVMYKIAAEGSDVARTVGNDFEHW